MDRDDQFTHYFTVDGGMKMGVTASREGKPVGWLKSYPVYAKYFLLDELDNLLLDPNMGWFARPEEALFVARLYQKGIGGVGFSSYFNEYCLRRDRLIDDMIAEIPTR